MSQITKIFVEVLRGLVRTLQKVANICEEAFCSLGDNTVKVVIDIDEQLDLYMFLKRKRIITGIPCALAWHSRKDRDYDLWYIPDDSVLSSDQNDTINFFQRQLEKSN